MSVAAEDMPDCEVPHDCGNKGSIVIRSRTTGTYFHVCPEVWQQTHPERFETVRSLD